MEDSTVASTNDLRSQITDAKRELVLQYKFLAVLWAVATAHTAVHRILVNLEASHAVAILTVQGCLLLCSLVMLVRPAWTTTLLASSTIHVGYVVWSMPEIHTSDVLWLLFSLPVAMSFGVGLLTRRSFETSPVGMYRNIAPCLRVVMILAVSATAIARINSVFLDPHSTPLRSLVERLPYIDSLNPWASYLAMSALIAIDMAIVVTLATSSLRRFAIGFGSAYFTFLATVGFAGARMQLPLLLLGLFLFGSSNLTNQVANAISVSLGCVRRRWLPLVLTITSVSAAILFVRTPEVSQLWTKFTMWLRHHPSQTAMAILLALAFLWIALLLYSLIEGQPRRTKLKLLPRTPLHYVVITLTLLMVGSPYLGLGTNGRFAEESGLTHAGYSRHLLIPTFDLFELEGDRIEILNSNAGYLQQLADDEKLITRLDFLRFVSSNPDTTATIVHDGELLEVSSDDIAELSNANQRICSKFISFSPTGREVVSIAGNN